MDVDLKLKVLLNIQFYVLDYVYDNCEDGKGVRFGLYCHYTMIGDYFSEQDSFCRDIDGRLSWFDSSKEYEVVINETIYQFSDEERNGHFYTGKCIFNAFFRILVGFKLDISHVNITCSKQLRTRGQSLI